MQKIIFVKYLIVGLLNTLIYTGLLLVFLQADITPVTISVGIAFLLAMLFQYIANKFFTFKIIERSWSEVARYILLALINYGISIFVILIVINVFQLSFFLAGLISALLVAFTGFTISFFWVYRS